MRNNFNELSPSQTRNFGIEVIIPVLLILLSLKLCNNYKDTHDECRMYKINIEKSFSDEVIFINDKESVVYIPHIGYKDSICLRYLSKEFLDSVNVGDEITKSMGENNVVIFREGKWISTQFSQIPKKECN